MAVGVRVARGVQSKQLHFHSLSTAFCSSLQAKEQGAET